MSASVTYHKVCQEQHCGKPFDTTDPTALFCGPTCKTNAKWSVDVQRSWTQVDKQPPRLGDLDATGWWGNAVRSMEA